MKVKLLILVLLFSLIFPASTFAGSEPFYPVPMSLVSENAFFQGVYARDLGYAYVEACSLDYRYQVKILIENHKVVFLSYLYFTCGTSASRFLYVNGAVTEDTLDHVQALTLLDRLLHFWPEGFPEKPEMDPLGAFSVFLAECWKL
ncbi:MAG: hypothetical protein QMD88_00985 [Coprothermobacterota bacterium]|nr:hypothetical protein [Coprothermobacterota bacterium]